MGGSKRKVSNARNPDGTDKKKTCFNPRHHHRQLPPLLTQCLRTSSRKNTHGFSPPLPRPSVPPTPSPPHLTQGKNTRGVHEDSLTFPLYPSTPALLLMSIPAARALSTFSPAGATLDALYPGTSVARMLGSRNAISASDLTGDWSTVVRPKLLDAAGLHDYPNARTHAPGQGYTGHAFQDWNHVAVCTMQLDSKDSENEGRVEGIHR